MTERRYDEGSWRFHDTALIPCVVTSVYPVDPSGRRLECTVSALDGRGSWRAPVMPSFGVTRNLRRGMTCAIQFRLGASNYPVIVGHIINTETDPGYRNPLPAACAYMADQVYEHPETGAFTRFRSAMASVTQSGPDGAACIYETTFVSGMSLMLAEYPQAQSGTAPPPKPNRAKASLTMPSGASIVIDEPSVGQATMSLTMPSGAGLTIDVNGNVIITSPKDVKISANSVHIDAPDVEVQSTTTNINAMVANVNAASINLNGATNIGGAGGGGGGGGGTGGGIPQPLAYKSDVEALRAELTVHTHSNGDNGGDTGPPNDAFPEPIGTSRTLAV